MRKGIKIKALFIFLSWMMIFIHGIIPHSHYEDVPFHHEFHDKSCIEEGSSMILKSHTDNETGCRISNLIFHKFSQDEQNYVVIHGPGSYNLISSETFSYPDFHDFISERFSDTASLRAPPLA